jgi:UDP-3-O-[3-hydroxymyristoyl] glucosamine N-acyltransferase
LKLTLREIALHVGGKVFGDPKILISGVSEIQSSVQGTITFLGNPKYRKYLAETQADAVFVSDENQLTDKNGILVTNPQLAMAQTLGLFYPEIHSKPFIHDLSTVDSNAEIGKNVTIESGGVIQSGAKIGDGSTIGSNTVIGPNVIIGQNCRINANVTIYYNTKIGDNCLIHSGTSIGSDGFGFVTHEGIHEKIPQTGNVMIGNDVEIGSNCAIDRATIGTTSIGDMTKMDNLVHIAHNVRVGKGCLITAGFAIAGSSEIGDFCTFAGQVGVAPHVKIGPNSTFAAKSGVTKSLKGGKVYAGYPAREIKEHNKRDALLNEISRLRKKLDQLAQDREEK